jgi:hypothetical protein
VAVSFCTPSSQSVRVDPAMVPFRWKGVLTTGWGSAANLRMVSTPPTTLAMRTWLEPPPLR